MKEISARLRDLKEKCGMTIGQLEAKTGMAHATITRIFSGATAAPSFQNVRDLTYAMGGSLDDIAGGPPLSEAEAEPNQKVEPVDALKETFGLLNEGVNSNELWLRRCFIAICVTGALVITTLCLVLAK